MICDKITLFSKLHFFRCQYLFGNFKDEMHLDARSMAGDKVIVEARAHVKRGALCVTVVMRNR